VTDWELGLLDVCPRRRVTSVTSVLRRLITVLAYGQTHLTASNALEVGRGQHPCVHKDT